MQSHRFRLKGALDHANAGHSSTVPGLIFGLAAVLFATQAISQTRLTRDAEARPQSVAAAISAPIPTVEEADLSAPLPIPFSSLEATQAGSESSSQSVPPPSPPAAAKTKPQHHGLGVALAVVGSAALAVGIAAYALGGGDFCGNEQSGGCKEARDAGLVLMPVGAGVAVTGFYFVFHR
jgi:hypothetical protein